MRVKDWWRQRSGERQGLNESADASRSTATPANPPLRVAVVSSPRCGNTWLSKILSSASRLETIAVHNPRDIPRPLGNSVMLQLHWYREPNFQMFLREHGFRVITIARHPLDVLVSSWRFRLFDNTHHRWLEGNTELPARRIDAAPCSSAFVTYATSFGAENLLCVSYLWWHDPNAIRLRYEDMAADPLWTFRGLYRALGREPAISLEDSLHRFDLEWFRRVHHHGWQGRPDIWRELIPWADAVAIFQRHRRLFEILGYDIFPETTLSHDDALLNWRQLNAPVVRDQKGDEVDEAMLAKRSKTYQAWTGKQP